MVAIGEANRVVIVATRLFFMLAITLDCLLNDKRFYLFLFTVFRYLISISLFSSKLPN